MLSLLLQPIAKLQQDARNIVLMKCVSMFPPRTINGYALNEEIEDIESKQSVRPGTTTRIDAVDHPGTLGDTVVQPRFNITEAIVTGKKVSAAVAAHTTD
ncbi:MAG: hypothetical protein JSW45_09180 [Thiotrichales bacterium]|nr:MAG: hypothetical protein JSW45_09180 [Thiotrichales bacterium]